MQFPNRNVAGKLLADRLESVLSKESVRNLVILSLPRGGVVLGYEIARHFDAIHDVICVKKIGHPDNPEYAVGSVVEQEEPIFDETERQYLDDTWVEQQVRAAYIQNERRRLDYASGSYVMDISGKTIVIVDDGVATGLTMRAALSYVIQHEPMKTYIAVPVIPKDVADSFAQDVSGIISIITPTEYMGAVGAYYREFEQVSDERVRTLLLESLRSSGVRQ